MSEKVVVKRLEKTGLVKFDAAMAAISKAKSVDELKDIRDRAEACRQYAKKAKLGLKAQNTMAEIKIRAERKAGGIFKGIEREEGGRPKQNSGHHVQSFPTALQKAEQEAGITHEIRLRWQTEDDVSEEQFEKFVKSINEAEEELTSASVLRLVKNPDWYQSSESPDWPTPQWLFDLLDAEFHFTLDVCATAKNAKCERFYTKKQNGLSRKWKGVCWMNPPYGREIADWMAKAKSSAENGATIVCLVPARPDTDWWWENALAGEIRFIRGRIQFIGTTSAAPFPSAVIVLGKNIIPRKVIWWEVSPNS